MVDVDLENDVVISKRGIDIYPDQSLKPERGEKLNKPALVNLYDVPPKNGQISEKSLKEHEKKLK